MYSYRRRSPDSEQVPSTATHPPYVSAADAQNFYPSKRPLTSTNVSPLTPDQITAETRTLYSMLDDFDVQPPFTIQRLCELIVSPTTHYNSGAKWISALKRCLSVTATRDAFPISPVQAPVGLVGVNGTHDEPAADLSELDMDRMDGLPPSSASVGGRSRSSSVGSNAHSEPLFSPIPFIVRDENGQMTHPSVAGAAATGATQQGQEGADANGVEAALMDPIPDLELEGADRTQDMDTLPKEVVDVAPSTSTSASTAGGPVESNTEGQQEDEAMAESDSADPSTSAATSSSATTADLGESVAAAVEASTVTPSTGSSTTAPASTPASTSAPTSAPTSEPLGVPDGEVDEIDNPSQTVHPLTSTTTSTTTTSSTPSDDTPASESSPTEPELTNPQKEETNDVDDAAVDNPRSSKRRKSVASIHDSRE